MPSLKKPIDDSAKVPSLGEAIKNRRSYVVPPYPIDQKTGKIRLPGPARQEVRLLLKAEGKPAAMKQVMALSGAGLRDAKAYVDRLDKGAAKKQKKR